MIIIRQEMTIQGVYCYYEAVACTHETRWDTLTCYGYILSVTIRYRVIEIVTLSSRHNAQIKKNALKPIFHQNAKYLASGTFASPNAKNSTSASPNAFASGTQRKPVFLWNMGFNVINNHIHIHDDFSYQKQVKYRYGKQ